MEIVQVILSSDTATLGDAATQEDLDKFGENLVSYLSKEFNCSCYYGLQACSKPSVRCHDPELEDRIRVRLNQILESDEWMDFLPEEEVQ